MLSNDCINTFVDLRLSQVTFYNFSPPAPTSTTCSTPSYSGNHKLYFSLISGLTNLFRTLVVSLLPICDIHNIRSLHCSRFNIYTYLPPIKCLPLKNFTNGFGAVRLTNTVGLKVEPGPSLGGPVSIFHDEGASTDVTGREVSCSASMTAGKGSRTSPEKENPIRKVSSVSWSTGV